MKAACLDKPKKAAKMRSISGHVYASADGSWTGGLKGGRGGFVTVAVELVLDHGQNSLNRGAHTVNLGLGGIKYKNWTYKTVARK
jgi:hypothetical protein